MVAMDIKNKGVEAHGRDFPKLHGNLPVDITDANDY
jgi:hypothetical protein